VIPALFLLLLLSVPVRAAEIPWKVHKEKHFLVHYLGKGDFAEQVGRRAEEYYRAVVHDLGISRRDDFWLWDNRTRIYLLESHRDFVEITGSPDWSGARTNYEKREIWSYRGSARFLDTLLPHELTHLVVRDYIGKGGNVPLWFDEGTAQWEERTGRREAKARAGELLRQGRFLPVEDLMVFDVRHKTGARSAEAFYSQSLSLVAFLMEKHGPERFRKLCSQLKAGKRFEDALRFTYPDRIRTIKELESQWKRYLEEDQ